MRRSTISSRARCDSDARPIEGDADTLVGCRRRRADRARHDRRRPAVSGQGARATRWPSCSARREAAIAPLRDGSYLTIYLAPHNYHRVHAPLGGRARPHALRARRALQREQSDGGRDRALVLPQRARRSAGSRRALGPMAVVLVGALNVSSISTIAARRDRERRSARNGGKRAPRPIRKGAEIGRFNMGSTVIVLLGARVAWTCRIGQGTHDARRPGARLARRAWSVAAMAYVATASHDTLRQRAAILAAIRAFFAARGVLEVETPGAVPGGRVRTRRSRASRRESSSLGPQPQYLQTSPEFAMKRLLAAGSGDIYQICRVFRDDELGRWHQPEFTLLEWYRVGWDEQRLMTEVEALIGAALRGGRTTAAPRRGIAFALHRRACAQRSASRAEASPAELTAARLAARGVDVPHGLESRRAAGSRVQHASWSRSSTPRPHVRLRLPRRARQRSRGFEARRPAQWRRASRYSARDRARQWLPRARRCRRATAAFPGRARRATAHGPALPPLDERLLAALATRLPDCAGVALGLDRLVALAHRPRTMSPSVLSFAHIATGRLTRLIA